jgi:hypothetical protein
MGMGLARKKPERSGLFDLFTKNRVEARPPGNPARSETHPE